MVAEVYVQTRPVSMWRGLFSSSLLLLVAAGLAASLSHSRLGQTIEVGGPAFGATFRCPSFFEVSIESDTASTGLIQLRGTGRGSSELILQAHRIKVGPKISALDICVEALSRHDPWMAILPGFSRTRSVEADLEYLGAHEGVEAVGDDGSSLARAAVVSQGRAYLFVMKVPGVRINPSTYRIFDRICQSFELVDGD